MVVLPKFTLITRNFTINKTLLFLKKLCDTIVILATDGNIVRYSLAEKMRIEKILAIYLEYRKLFGIRGNFFPFHKKNKADT